jgi:hypothetical protein
MICFNRYFGVSFDGQILIISRYQSQNVCQTKSYMSRAMAFSSKFEKWLLVFLMN